MKYHILAFGAGFLLDQLFGDPYFLPHPIRGIGWLIAKTEKTLRAGNPQGNPTEREGAERRQGKLLVVIVLLFTGMLSALILFGAYAMHPGLGVVIEAVMTYQILAARCLQVESSKVWKQLNAGSLEEARKAVSMIVGRNTEHLTEEGVAKAAIETVAEKDPAAAAFIVKTTQYFVPMAGKIDAEAERKKLADDLAYYEGFLASVMKKLSNERFVASAPEKVVANERAKQADAEAKITAIREQLAALESGK